MLRLDQDDFSFPSSVSALSGELSADRLAVVINISEHQATGMFELESRSTMTGAIRDWLFFMVRSIGGQDGPPVEAWSALSAMRLVEFAKASRPKFP